MSEQDTLPTQEASSQKKPSTQNTPITENTHPEGKISLPMQPTKLRISPQIQERSQEPRTERTHDRHQKKNGNEKTFERNDASDEHEEINLGAIDPGMIIKIAEMKEKSYDEILKIAEELNIDGCVGMPKRTVIFSILRIKSQLGYLIEVQGVLEIVQDGFGFLRSMTESYSAAPDDIYVASHQVRKFGLRTGDNIVCYAKAPKAKEKYFAMQKIIKINGADFGQRNSVPNFDDLTPWYPKEMLNFDINLRGEGEKYDQSTRVINLISPI